MSYYTDVLVTWEWRHAPYALRDLTKTALSLNEKETALSLNDEGDVRRLVLFQDMVMAALSGIHAPHTADTFFLWRGRYNHLDTDLFAEDVATLASLLYTKGAIHQNILIVTEGEDEEQMTAYQVRPLEADDRLAVGERVVGGAVIQTGIVPLTMRFAYPRGTQLVERSIEDICRP